MPTFCCDDGFDSVDAPDDGTADRVAKALSLRPARALNGKDNRAKHTPVRNKLARSAIVIDTHLLGVAS